MGKTTIASKIDEDSELLERFKEFEDETGYGNRSKALRAALRRGLDQYDEEAETDGRRDYTLVEELLLNAAVVIAAVAMLIPVLYLGGVIPQATTIVTGLLYLGVSAAIVLGVEFRARRSRTDTESNTSGGSGAVDS